MIRDYKYHEKVLGLLETSDIPLAIESVRKYCGIGSWVTAKSILLELLLEKRVSGIKTSKSWVFWNNSVDKGVANERT